MCLKDCLYICICLSWPAALEHRIIEENSVNSGFFNGLGRQGNWKHCKKLCFGKVLCAKCVNYGVLKENTAKTCKHTSKNTGFGGFCGKKMKKCR